MENNLNLKQSKSEESEEMTIKIQTLDNIYPLTVKRSSTVAELKDMISYSLSVPVPKQRLIFQGRLLQPTEKLKTYKIEDDNVIHLVAKTLDENAQQTSTETNNTQNEYQRVSVEDMFSGVFEIPIATRARRPRRRRVPHFDISESFESMHQNILTLQNLQQCKNKFDDQQVNSTKTIIPFELGKSKYEVGQWVDVKDTIDQWLEAQVVQVRNNQVYIHYNGWGNRWDEWIDFSSPRIASFKTYSQQSPTSVFLSPYPSIVPDANMEPQHRNIDTFFYMDKTVGFLNDIIKHFEIMNKIRRRNVRVSDFNNKEMKISDFEESKTNNITTSTSQTNNSNNINLINNNDHGPNLIRSQVMNSSHAHGSLTQNSLQMQLTTNDYELLFYYSQIVPLMDRTGRLLSDVSLHLSHLLLNSNLYPQLLLGNNNTQNEGFSDNLSCTSGYSIYTNEGSTVSGLITQPNAEIGVNTTSTGQMTNNRSNTLGIQSIQNSNQMINNYTNLIQNNNNSTTINTPNTITTNQNVYTTPNTSNNQSNTQNTTTTSTTTNSTNNPLTSQNTSTTINVNNTNTTNTTNNSGSSTNVTSINNITNNTNVSSTTNPNHNFTVNNTNNNTPDIQPQRINDTLPKINLQVPAMLSMAEVALVNGYNYNESNIDIYVHTISTRTQNQTTNNEANTSATNNLVNLINQTNQTNNNANHQANQHHSQSNSSVSNNSNRIMEALRSQTTPQQTNNSTASNEQSSTTQTNPNSLFDNILNLISQSVSNRNSNINTNNNANNQNSSNNTTTSTSNNLTSNTLTTQSAGTSASTSHNTRQQVSARSYFSNVNNNRDTTSSNSNQPTSINNNLLLTNNLTSSGNNFNNNIINNTRLSKDNKETQTDGGSEENNMLNISDNKSDNYKKYYTKSLKSVSDVSDFEQQFHDEEHSDTKSNKKLDRNDLKSVKSNTLSKLHELDESYQSDNASKNDNEPDYKADEKITDEKIVDKKTDEKSEEKPDDKSDKKSEDK